MAEAMKSEHAGTAGRIVNSIRAKDGDQWSISRSEAIESVEMYAAVVAAEATFGSHAVLVQALRDVERSGRESARHRKSKYGDVVIGGAAWDSVIEALANLATPHPETAVSP